MVASAYHVERPINPSRSYHRISFPRSLFKMGHISVNSAPHRIQASLTHCPDAHKDTVSFRPIHSPTCIAFSQNRMPKEEIKSPHNLHVVYKNAWISRNPPVDKKGIPILPIRARDFGYFASSVDRARSSSERAFLNPFEQIYQMRRRVDTCCAPYAQLLFIFANMMSREDEIRDPKCCLLCCC